MLNKAIVNAILKSASVEAKDEVIRMLLDNISQGCFYNDNRCNHILEMLVDKTTVKSEKDINLDYIKEHPDLILYKFEEYNIKDITIDRVDNIDCEVIIKFKALEKINEDRADVTYSDRTSNISYINYPQVLK